MTAGKLLLVDDDVNFLELATMRLEAADYHVARAHDGPEAAHALRTEIFDLCIVDLRLADGDGISVMNEIHAINPDMPVLILTGHASVNTAVKAMKEGAFNYLTKPFEASELLVQIQRALEHRRLDSEVRRLKALLNEKYDFSGIIAESDAMRNVLDVVARIAKTDSTVYLSGESGTGKEIIAKTIHLASQRKDKPFIAISCAALPETLLESELFGHEKGAFTGADRSTKGLIAQADQGTILLDEIGDMPPSIQAKLLRAIQERQFYPVGGERPVAVDVRIIVATNKDLREEVKKGSFREDLFYRLHVIPIHLPPLRARRDDILPLANFFLDHMSRRMKKDVKGFTPEAVQKLMVHDWPGNIRELENAVEYALAMTQEDMITADALLHAKARSQKVLNDAVHAEAALFSPEQVKSYKEARFGFERQYLIRLLKLSAGRASEAAKLARKSRTDFYELLRKHQIKIDSFKRPH